VRVAKTANNDAAQGAHQKPDAKHGKRRQQPCVGIVCGKELLGDRTSEEDVDAKVIPFEHIANCGSDYRLARLMRCGRRDGLVDMPHRNTLGRVPEKAKLRFMYLRKLSVLSPVASTALPSIRRALRWTR
jgi:hypothetical protein